MFNPPFFIWANLYNYISQMNKNLESEIDDIKEQNQLITAWCRQHNDW